MSEHIVFGKAGWSTGGSYTRGFKGFRPMHVDPTTWAQVEIAAEHHEIHEGHMWHLTDEDLDVDIAGPKYWHILTPALNPDVTGLGYVAGSFNNYYVHFAAMIYTDTDASVEFFEGPTLGGAGTALTPRWRNRNREDTEILSKLYYDPTVNADGTQLAKQTIVTANNPIQSIGGDLTEGRTEWLLAPATSYLVKVTVTADNALVRINSNTYEHPHKDNWWEANIT